MNYAILFPMDTIEKLLIQQEYANQLSPYLERFQVISQSPYKATFRCDNCGDSQKSKHKKRGSIYERDYELFYGCYNCGASFRFETYLREHHHNLYQSYLMDIKVNKPKFKYKSNPCTDVIKSTQKNDPFQYLIPITDVPKALGYIKGRKIPSHQYSKLFYIENFYEFVNKIIPNKFSEEVLKYDHERIVIPFIDIMGTCFGFQGRTFEDGDFRYITIMINEDQNKIFGLDEIDYSKTAYCVEGPFDSLFLPNSCAMAGSDINTLDKSFVIVLDNEPRNAEIVKKYHKYIERGYKICIWPSNNSTKDINDLILSGMSVSEIVKLIDSNTYSGINAKIKYNKWRKL